MTTSEIALYLHFPFCRRKCGYCSFVSLQGREADIPAYVDALAQELSLRAAGQRISTVYFGGGTPSLLSPRQVKQILGSIRLLCALSASAEVTLEANPGTVDEAHLMALRESGVNRLSLGVQSLEEDELRLLGRLHTAAEAREAVRQARRAGFANMSIDLIYGLPGGSLQSWHKTLEEVVEMGPEHLSLYPLTLEEGVPLQQTIDRGALPKPDPDLAADQYELAQDFLAASGYQHYEISNWARPGYECRHNIVYWRNLYYLGIGVAAHSHLDHRRSANTKDLDDYLTTLSRNVLPPQDLEEQISHELHISETIILGLRLTDGLRVEEVRTRFGIDLLAQYGFQVEELAKLGLLEYDGQHLRLTRHGRLLGNEVFWRFLPQER